MKGERGIMEQEGLNGVRDGRVGWRESYREG